MLLALSSPRDAHARAHTDPRVVQIEELQRKLEEERAKRVELEKRLTDLQEGNQSKRP